MGYMKHLMTKHFLKWVSKQKISDEELETALLELQEGHFDASLGGYLYKKRIRFEGQGKSGSGRTIICYRKEDRAIFIHGFAKNDKANLSPKELRVFKELARIIMQFSAGEIQAAIKNGDFIEVKS